jgi:multicomponent Na+:H+ antiporter subunit D
MTDEPRALASLVPALAVALPLAGALLSVPLARVSRRVQTGVLAVLCGGTALLSLVLIALVLGGSAPETRILHLMPGIWIHLRIDAMGALFGATVSTLWLLALIYSHGYLGKGPAWTRYHGFFMLCLGLTLGVAYAGNLVTFLIFYELFSILTYPLIVHDETPEAMAAGRKYIVYILLGGSLVMLGVILTWFAAGAAPFGEGPVLGEGLERGRLMGILACFLLGFGVKAAIFPLHGWVPDAHPAAPAPFSAVLSGVMVAAGAFGIMRVVLEVFGPGLLGTLGVMPWVSWAASFTVVFAAVLALRQDDLKRRLAWSTISQMAYATLAVSLLGAGATAGALVHITHHAFMKGALFLCAGLLIRGMGIRRISEMGGVARRMPWTMAAFSVAALGMIGTPPLSGFVSKWVIGLGMVEAEQPLYLAVLLGGALLAAVYLMPIVYTAYFGEGSEEELGGPLDRKREAPLSMLVPTLAAAAMTVVLGLGAALPGLPLSLARLAVRAFFG